MLLSLLVPLYLIIFKYIQIQGRSWWIYAVYLLHITYTTLLGEPNTRSELLRNISQEVLGKLVWSQLFCNTTVLLL